MANIIFFHIFLYIFQVLLGVIPKSETNYEDMTEILEHDQTYVPSISCEKNIPGTGIAQDQKFVTSLVGGDYLSVARARGAQLIRSTSELIKHSLGGMLPVAEDGYAKVCFMEASLFQCLSHNTHVGGLILVKFYCKVLSLL